MAVALFVVPGIALAYLWIAPRGRLAALRQLTLGGVAMAVVGLAWPLLVTLTPAADRPWISGTSDNSIWSLIFNYNGVGRVTGQTGAPGRIGGGGGGGGAFGGSTGVFRLLQSGLGDQAGWLLGFAHRRRPRHPRGHAAAPLRCAHRLADRRRRRVCRQRRRVQLRVGHLPPLLRLVPRAVGGDARRRRRRAGAVGRPDRPDRRAAGDRRRGDHRAGRARQPVGLAVLGQAAGDRRRLSPARSRWRSSSRRGCARRARRWRWRRCWPRRRRGRPRRSATPRAAPSPPAAPPARSMGGFGGPGGRRAAARWLRRLVDFGGGGGALRPVRRRAPGRLAPRAASRHATGGGIQSLFSGSAPGTRRGGGSRRGGFGGFGGGGMFGGDSASLEAAADVRQGPRRRHGRRREPEQRRRGDHLLATPTSPGSAASPGARARSARSGWRWRSATAACAGSWPTAPGRRGFGGFGGDSRQGSAAALAIAEKVGRKVTFTSGRTR